MALSEGVKYDEGKLRYDLMSVQANEGLVRVLTFGANKYEPRNWERGIGFGRVFGAAMRHLWAWWRGEDYDPESGLHHLHHAACCIHFLQHYAVDGRYDQHDDRPAFTPQPCSRLVNAAEALNKVEDRWHETTEDDMPGGYRLRAKLQGEQEQQQRG